MKNERIVFLDWMRVVACFMVMAIHSAEPFFRFPDAYPFNAPYSTAVVMETSIEYCSFGVAATAAAAFACSSIVAILVRRIPLVGKWICG